MREKRNLIFGRSFFFLIIFIIFGVIVILEKGNPIKFYVAKKELESYIEENYPSLYQEFDVSSLSFKPKENSYNITVHDKRNKDLLFRIYYGNNNKVIDTYQEDYIEGNTYRLLVENKMTKTLQDKIKKNSLSKEFSSYKVSMLTSLDKLDSSDRDALINKKNISELNIYTIEATTNATNMNAINYAEKFLNLCKLTEEINFYPISYKLLICMETEESKCVEVNNVTRKVMQDEDIESIFQIMLQNKEKVEQEYGITYKIIKKEILVQ